MNILKPYFIRLSVLCLLLVTSGNFSFAILDTKRFDAKATKRVNYLHYSNPGTLRFSEPEPSVDRGNLLVFIPVSRAAASPATNSEGNSTNLPSFHWYPTRMWTTISQRSQAFYPDHTSTFFHYGGR